MNFRQDNPSKSATTLAPFAENLSPQVLVVDDAREIRTCLSFLLRAIGYRVLEAEDGMAAQTILSVEHPALVITDLEMPVCDGWSLLTFCHAKHPELPVLICSGSAIGKQPQVEGWAAGYLPKPFDVEMLRTEVQRLISQAAA
jgi:CheY-like chemotaxis protein